jgi:1-acyl-sn-glycerol-3-phosphate acyltransferase
MILLNSIFIFDPYMMRFFFRLLFKLRGWKIKGGMPPGLTKCVLVAAPHTSNWDFVYGLAAADLFGVDFRYLAKKELFRFPIKRLLLNSGGMPVERKQSTSMVDTLIHILKEKGDLVILFPPEGTRGRVEKWKSGFYHAALGANVPIVLSYMDYSKKEACIGTCFLPTGNYKKDFKLIYDFYKDVKAKDVKNFNPDAIIQTASSMQ